MKRGRYNPSLPYTAIVSQDDIVTLTDTNGYSMSYAAVGAYQLTMIITGGAPLKTSRRRGECYSLQVLERRRAH